MPMAYQVTFTPGRYRYYGHKGPSGNTTYMIGRCDDGAIIGWSHDEERAKHIVLALNLVDAYVSHDTASEREIIHVLDKLRSH